MGPKTKQPRFLVHDVISCLITSADDYLIDVPPSHVAVYREERLRDAYANCKQKVFLTHVNLYEQCSSSVG
ncbi:hypothetical protein PHET_02905 [Paragonimus heterotremus]|uniref:Uncharacterized protein n=1 Tax=Paragonimus heterotremus TaxID=100268 RepID=A0A8J4T1E6_9TREM|nr:hypothetical protein PHET_02905 [Paragonimus heterotremus]